jgi:RimJ/RimL family protein N-acetyltransferase
MAVEIIYPTEEYFASFHKALDQVAREEVYIEMTEAKPFEEVANFQRTLIKNNWPGCYALENGEVVGWADAFPASNPRLCHRAFLGMGLLKSHRGKGIGSQLLNRVIDHAKRIGLEKIELTVYTNNEPAIHLYKKCGFTEIGVIKHYRKLRDRYFDCVEMELFL